MFYNPAHFSTFSNVLEKWSYILVPATPFVVSTDMAKSAVTCGVWKSVLDKV